MRRPISQQLALIRAFTPPAAARRAASSRATMSPDFCRSTPGRPVLSYQGDVAQRIAGHTERSRRRFQGRQSRCTRSGGILMSRVATITMRCPGAAVSTGRIFMFRCKRICIVCERISHANRAFGLGGHLVPGPEWKKSCYRLVGAGWADLRGGDTTGNTTRSRLVAPWRAKVASPWQSRVTLETLHPVRGDHYAAAAATDRCA